MLLELKALTALGENREIKNVNLSIVPYEVYGIAELDGDARHELFQSIVEPAKYHKGEVFYKGYPLKLPCDFREIALVEASPFFFKGKTVEEQLRLHMAYLGLYQERAITDILDQVGLRDKQNDLADTLSLKDRKKLSLARGLVGHPDLLIVDDLTDGLDGQTTKELMAILWQLKREDQTTVLFSTQDLKLLEDFSDRIGCLKQGQLDGEITGEMLATFKKEYLEFETPQLKAVAMLLHDTLGIDQFKLIEPNKVQIFEWSLTPNQLLKAMIEKDIDIRGFSIEQRTIEDYYNHEIEVVR